MPIEITISNVDDLIDKLRAKKLEGLLRDAFQMSAKYVRGIARTYPGPRPGSTYKRRGFGGGLASKWTYEFSALEARIFVPEGHPYAEYVQGERQTWFHAETGWKTAEQISTDTEESVRKQFEEVINAGYQF